MTGSTTARLLQEFLGARSNNNDNDGIAGINWHSPLISTNVFTGDWAENQEEIALTVDAGARVLNHSWETLPSGLLVPQIGKALAYAHNMDCLNIAAAGNDSVFTSAHYPSDFPHVISVGATDYNDDHCLFSNYGPNIDLAAPGMRIWSTLSPYSQYAHHWGTSFATPVVSGAASLLKSDRPDLWNDDIQQLLLLSATDLTPSGWDMYYGHGRLNADAAFHLLQLPNSFANNLVASGNTYNAWVSGYDYYHMFVPGLADGVHRIKVYDVRRDVTFAREYFTPPAVWGRGAASASSGWVSENQMPIFNFRNCEVVPGSVTTTGCTLRGYTYEVWARDGFGGWSYRGFKPVGPSTMVFPYSILGEYKLLPPTVTTATKDLANDRILLVWDDPNPNENRIIVKRKAIDAANWGDWQDLDHGDQTSIYQTGLAQLTGCQIYQYKVVFLNERQESNNSQAPVASFRNLANAPSNVTAGAMERTSEEGGGPSQRISISWAYPANQLANSVKYYKAKIQYPDHVGVTEWKDSLYGYSTQFCATYWNEPVSITMYAISNQDTLGRPSTPIEVQAGGYAPSCNILELPPNENSTTPPGDSLSKAALPTEFALEQNYPNPFNPVISIALSIPRASDLRLEVFNALGQRVRTLYVGSIGAGRHEFQWDGRDASGKPVGSGVYFYRFDAGAFSDTKKMLLLK